MNDKQIEVLFMGELLPALQALPGLALLKMARSHQQRQHGASNAPYVYFFKIGDHRYGFPARRDRWDVDAEQFDHIETAQYEATYQFTALVPQDPNDAARLTESDVLNMVAGVLQSDTMLATFREADVGILRIADVRNPYVVNDRDEFMAGPSFDVILTYKRELVTTLPAVVTYEAKVGRV